VYKIAVNAGFGRCLAVLLCCALLMHYFTWENVLDFIKNTNLYRTFQTDLYCIASCKQIRDGSWHWEKLRVWSVWWIVFLKVLYTLNCILYVT